MSWRDREYARGAQGGGRVWPPTRRVALLGGSVVTTLIVINVAVAKRWRGIRVTLGDLEKLNALRAEVALLDKTA